MKKLSILFLCFLFLTGCVESMAFLGHSSTVAGSGNVTRSMFSSAVSLGVKKQTGKSPTEHAVTYVKKHNPQEKEEKCLSFLESSKSELCSAVKQNILNTKRKIVEKSKIKYLNK